MLTDDQLRERLASQEDSLVERKVEGVNAGEVRRTATAFANTVPEGAVAMLFIGIHDRTGEVLGVGDPDGKQKWIRDQLHRECYPPIPYHSTVLDIAGKHVVAVQFPHSDRKPHFAGAAFVRVGSESVNATEQQYEQLLASRNDKAREILKHGNVIFTVMGLGYRVGSNAFLAEKGYRESRECRVEACDAHNVRLFDISTSERITEPLRRIDPTWDEKKYRPMLNVTFD